MKKLFKIILILIVLLILLFIINLIRNTLIINKLFSAESKLGNITDYYYKHEDNDIKQIQEVYENENYFLEIITTNNTTFKVLFDKTTNTLTTISKDNKITTENNSAYKITAPYKNVFFLEDTDKSEVIKEYFLKPITTEDNFYIIKYNNSETSWYVNKDTYQIEKYISAAGNTSYYTINFSDISDEIFNDNLKNQIENSEIN